MKIPLSFGELSVVRSIGRLLIPMAGIGLVLATLYAGTVWMERILLEKEDLKEMIPTITNYVDVDGELQLPDTEYLFPYRTELESADGRKMDALLLGRPSSNNIIVQRTADKRIFSLGLNKLSPDSQLFLSEFPASRRSRPEAELFRLVFPDRPLAESSLQFPHVCTLVSTDERTLRVTLLSRPTASEVTFRREIDRRIYTIPLTRLIKSDREFIRLFAVESDANTPVSGLR